MAMPGERKVWDTWEALWQDAKDPGSTQVTGTSSDESTGELWERCLTQADQLMSIHGQVAEETWKQWEIAGQCCKESNTFVSWSTSLMFQNSEVVLHHIAGEVHLIILKLRNCMYINIGDIEKKNDHVEREKEWVDRLSLEEKIRSCKFCTCYNYMWRSKALKVSQVRNN